MGKKLLYKFTTLIILFLFVIYSFMPIIYAISDEMKNEFIEENQLENVGVEDEKNIDSNLDLENKNVKDDLEDSNIENNKNNENDEDSIIEEDTLVKDIDNIDITKEEQIEYKDIDEKNLDDVKDENLSEEEQSVNFLNPNDNLLEEGAYFIKAAFNTNIVLSVQGDKTENRANVQMNTNNNLDSQKWIVKKFDDTYYTITSVKSKKVLDIYGNYNIPGTNMIQYDCNYGSGQLWKIRKNDDNTYSIISKNGLALDIYGGYLVDNTNVQVYTDHNGVAQKFTFEEIIDTSGTINKYGKTIENGLYNIQMSISKDYVVDIDSAKKQSGANVQLYRKQEGREQKFEIEYGNDGYYTIKLENTNLCLDVYGGYKTPGTNVTLFEFNNSDNQKWIIKKNSDNTYSIISKCNGLNLDIYGGYTSNNTNIQVYNDNKGSAQKFSFEKLYDINDILANREKTIESGTYNIKMAVANKYVLDIDGIKRESGANVQIYQKNINREQKFQVEYIGDGYYVIKLAYTNLCLDVYGGYKTPGTNVTLFEFNNSDNQKWVIGKNSDNTYSIISKCNGLKLDIYGGYTANNTNIQVYTGNNSGAQKFIFETPQYYKPEKTIEDSIYRFVYTDSNKSLEVNNNNLIMNNTNLSNAQKFNVIYNNDGYYKIKLVGTNKVLTIKENTVYQSTVICEEDKNDDSQLWIFKKVGNSDYKIISKKEELFLDSSNLKDGNKVLLQLDNNKSTQIFKLIDMDVKGTTEIANGVYQIKTQSDKVVEVASEKQNNGANIQINSNKKETSQKFRITRIEGTRYYKIKAIHSNKMVDIYGGYITPGTNVQQFEDNNGDNQLWMFKKSEDGKSYTIISKNTGLCLDIYGGYVNQDGTNIQMYYDNKEVWQKFKLELASIIENGIYNITCKNDTCKTLDVYDKASYDNANIIIWEKNNQENQKYKFEYLSNEQYKITANHSGKALTAKKDGSVVQETYTGKTEQKWKIVESSGDCYRIMSIANNKYLDIDGQKIEEGRNLKLYETPNSDTQLFRIIDPTKGLSYVSIDENKYPGFLDKIHYVQELHPNWKIRVKYTGLDWNEALNCEDDYDGNKSPYSLTQFPTWFHSGDSKDYEGGWRRASREAIAYTMDPRNYLNDTDIFQFQDLSNTLPVSYSDIYAMIQGTYLMNSSVYNVNSVINTILNACKTYNVSPFAIVSRMIQEQTGGWCQNGYVYNGRTVFNLFNINATGSTTEQIIERGATKAYNEHWFTPETCIMGSVRILANTYVGAGQYTQYYQKFNIVNKKPYHPYHQYMQNISAPTSEGRRMAKKYRELNMMDYELVFEIPLYENMPSEISRRP